MGPPVLGTGTRGLALLPAPRCQDSRAVPTLFSGKEPDAGLCPCTGLPAGHCCGSVPRTGLQLAMSSLDKEGGAGPAGTGHSCCPRPLLPQSGCVPSPRAQLQPLPSRVTAKHPRWHWPLSSGMLGGHRVPVLLPPQPRAQRRQRRGRGQPSPTVVVGIAGVLDLQHPLPGGVLVPRVCRHEGPVVEAVS